MDKLELSLFPENLFPAESKERKKEKPNNKKTNNESLQL